MDLGLLSFALTVQLLCNPLPTYNEYSACFERAKKCLAVNRNNSLSECVNFLPKEKINGK